jgi:hypothetical protein
MKANQILFASMLGLASTIAMGQAPAPGHDMNEQNTLAPGMIETMRAQDKNAPGRTPVSVTGHDMNEHNINAPGMREQMNREAGKATTRDAARVANPGHEMNEQNIHRPGMHEEMNKR